MMHPGIYHHDDEDRLNRFERKKLNEQKKQLKKHKETCLKNKINRKKARQSRGKF